MTDRLAILVLPILVRVDDEREATEKAQALYEASLAGGEAALSKLLFDDDDLQEPEDFQKVRDAVSRMVASLPPQVLMLPEEVVEGPDL